MANRAADLIEELCADLRIQRVGNCLIARRRFRGPHKACENIHVIIGVFDVRYCVERRHRASPRRIFRTEQAVRDAHFMEIGVRLERQQTGILPTKASNTRDAGRFQHGHANDLPRNRAAALTRLIARNVHQRFIRNRFDKAVA